MLSGAILAGGQNRRMGGNPKALMSIGGRPLLRIQLEEMAKLCKQIWVVTNTPELMEPITSGFRQAEVLLIPDTYPNTGPMGGIHAACHEATAERLWIVGCDMPCLSSLAANVMLEQNIASEAAAIVPNLANKIHPLHAIYHRERTGAGAEQLLKQQNYKLMELLRHLDAQHADEAFFTEKGIDLSFVTNLNTLEEYRKMICGDVK
ncbi:molybdenum cofactor guanylyltransferase [Paenibacillus sp. TAF58]